MIICFKCGVENDADAEYCENCGNQLKLVCTNCGIQLKPGVKFCSKCGHPVNTEQEQSEESGRLASLRQGAPADLQEKIRSASRILDGQRKPVTILFADIVGSTAIAEKLDPEEWKEIVSCVHQRIGQAIFRYEGTIAQLLGDGVLAFFGAPVTHEDDPLRAVRAALDIQTSITEYARELQGYVDNFQLRIGINTGLVVISNVGSDLHVEYLAVGDAVNLAARLQSIAQPGKVLISQSTARLVGAAFALQSLGEISVKGREEPVNVFEVLERRYVPESERGFEALRSPVVGRQKELSLLRIALQSLVQGHGHIISLIGDAGIGKSRLVTEIRNSSDLDAGENPPQMSRLHWIEGRALSYGQTLSYWTITQMIKNDLGLSDGDPEPRIRISLRKSVNNLFGSQAGELLPYLNNLLGVMKEDEQADRLQILDGETLKRQTLLSITRYFEQMAREHPVVLVFEDLHWIDPSSLQVLQALLALTDRVSLMLLLLFRPERDLPSWRIKIQVETDYPHRYTEILLQPLSSDEQNQLVDNLLAISDLPDGVRQQILDRAEGNPFYLEEIVRSLVEQGGIVRKGNRWSVTGEVQQITIPSTLQGVLMARIDRLEEDVRCTLQQAAVIGKSFLYRLLEAISEAEKELDQHLAQLQRFDLVREKSRLPELEYMFKHSLTQEAAYSSLLVERRRDFHRRVGEAIEELFTERKREFLGLLAHHFDAAGERDKAVAYLIQAGDRARLTDEQDEAVDFYQRACQVYSEIGNERNESEAAQAWLKLGMVYHVNFQFENAHLAFKNAFIMQQKARLKRQVVSDDFLRVLRGCTPISHVSLDPGIACWVQDCNVIGNLFSGLVEIDEKLNLVPNVAHSWQVLEGGKRYILHLRGDVFWTDGKLVTAQDFEWTWKRNLAPDLISETATYLFDIVGAREYNSGQNPDPGCVGVHALDALTLEVQLVEPVAYFPYLLALPVTYPLPRAAIERHGVSWWRAGNMISNGAFQLLEFDIESGGIMERNPNFHGEFPGNLHRVQWVILQDIEDRLRNYRENRIDFAYFWEYESITDFPPSEKADSQLISLLYLQFGEQSPLDDLRVRRALALALDKQELSRQFNFPFASGGFIPPRLPGHSPDLGLDFNLESARQLFAEAGYPDGHGFPVLKGFVPITKLKIAAQITHQWRDHLGIEANFEGFVPTQLAALRKQGTRLPYLLLGIIADYPDPDSLLGYPGILTSLRNSGWQDDHYDRLIENAARTTDRSKRLALYRQADRYLVAEQVMVLPLTYIGASDLVLCKPWIKNYQVTPLGRELFQNVIALEH